MNGIRHCYIDSQQAGRNNRMDKSSLAPYKNANKQEIIEAVERDIKKEWEKHLSNILPKGDLRLLSDYLNHNDRLRDVFIWSGNKITSRNDLLIKNWRWPLSEITHNGNTYTFRISSVVLDDRLGVYRNVYRNGEKTNSRVLRTLWEKRYQAVDFINRNLKTNHRNYNESEESLLLPLIKDLEDCSLNHLLPLKIEEKSDNAGMLPVFWIGDERGNAVDSVGPMSPDVNYLKFPEIDSLSCYEGYIEKIKNTIESYVTSRSHFNSSARKSAANPSSDSKNSIPEKKKNVRHVKTKRTTKKVTYRSDYNRQIYFGSIINGANYLSNLKKQFDIRMQGAVNTPVGMADKVSSQLIEHLSSGAKKYNILDPSVGNGQLLDSLLRQLSELEEWEHAKVSVTGYSVDPDSLRRVEAKLREKYKKVVFEFKEGNFLNEYIEGKLGNTEFDIIISSPPHIPARTMGSVLSTYLSKSLDMDAKTNMAYYFAKAAATLLSSEGVCGLILSNTFMTATSDREFRNHLIKNTSIQRIINFGKSKYLNGGVLPCSLIYKKGRTEVCSVKTTSVLKLKNIPYKGPKVRMSFSIFEVIGEEGICEVDRQFFKVIQGGLCIPNASGNWRLASIDEQEWVKKVHNNTTLRFQDVAEIKTGIKTGDDLIYCSTWKEWLGDDRKKPELFKPLIGSIEGGNYLPCSENHSWVLYPYTETNGKTIPVNLSDYPNTKEYLVKYKSRLESRACIRNGKKEWFELQKQHDASAWKNKKVVISDRRKRAEFWMDETGSIVEGRCLWLQLKPGIADDMYYLILGIANSNFIEKYYDLSISSESQDGKRRLTKKYVDQFPLPDSKKPEAQKLIRVVRGIGEGMTFYDQNLIDKLVCTLFGVQEDERKVPAKKTVKNSDVQTQLKLDIPFADNKEMPNHEEVKFA